MQILAQRARAMPAPPPHSSLGAHLPQPAAFGSTSVARLLHLGHAKKSGSFQPLSPASRLNRAPAPTGKCAPPFLPVWGLLCPRPVPDPWKVRVTLAEDFSSEGVSRSIRNNCGIIRLLIFQEKNKNISECLLGQDQSPVLEFRVAFSKLHLGGS